METRLAVMGIIVKSKDSVQTINEILHEYNEYIIGRMGIPYKERNISLISVALDAPQDKISAISGKIGNLMNVEVKTAFA